MTTLYSITARRGREQATYRLEFQSVAWLEKARLCQDGWTVTDPVPVVADAGEECPTCGRPVTWVDHLPGRCFADSPAAEKDAKLRGETVHVLADWRDGREGAA